MMKTIKAGNVKIGAGGSLSLIAGPCVIESRRACMELAASLARLAASEGIPLVFKASYDKANRSSIRSFRGPGLDKGLDILAEIKERYDLPILTDVHRDLDVSRVAEVADIIQVPAFLCRQTDLLIAAAESGRAVNVKKGQFVAPADCINIIEKLEGAGCKRILMTERGTCFGYNNLVVDMRSLLILREMGYPVVFDATHSVQLPGAGGDCSGGDARWVPALARAAVAAGCHAVFIETHKTPGKARCDRNNAVPFNAIRRLWRELRGINEIVG